VSIFSDIETEIGSTGYQTTNGATDSSLTVDYVGGVISAFSDVTDLMTLPADYEDTGITLIGGDAVSVYGDDAENTVVVLNDDGVDKWVHVFRYADASDYGDGKVLNTPAVGLRV